MAFLRPKKLKRAKMGVRPPARLVFSVHRAYVKRHACALCGYSGPEIEFMHLRTAANSGTGIKPGDQFGIPGCRDCHRDCHQRGHDTVAREHGTTLEKLFALAAHFAKTTTDKALIEALREQEHAG
jgi:hypothetical protein